MLNINEMFHSVQGEGRTVGRNVVFLRLAKCNLGCSFCDSKYSWEKGTDIKDKKILSYIKKTNAQGLCITGGEPLLQQKNIIKLIKRISEPDFEVLLPDDFIIEIETNGTIEADSFLLRRPAVSFNISPKLTSSGNNNELLAKYDEKETLKKFAVWRRKTIFKFVVTDQKDLKEIKDIIEKNNINEHQVYLMPEGMTINKQQKAQRKVIEWALKNGWNFSPRIQVLIWNKKRGV